MQASPHPAAWHSGTGDTSGVGQFCLLAINAGPGPRVFANIMASPKPIMQMAHFVYQKVNPFVQPNDIYIVSQGSTCLCLYVPMFCKVLGE